MVDIKINKRLNLTMAIDVDGQIWHVHSMPISREVFEDNFLVLSKTFTDMYTYGIGGATGPRIAALLLKKTAQELGLWEHVQSGLIGEIHRLTNVLKPAKIGGYETIPYHQVISSNMLDEDQVAEVENTLTFFIVASALHLKSELPIALIGLISMWKAQTTLLNVTDYSNSLKIQTKPEITGEIPPTSQLSVPF